MVNGPVLFILVYCRGVQVGWERGRWQRSRSPPRDVKKGKNGIWKYDIIARNEKHEWSWPNLLGGGESDRERESIDLSPSMLTVLCNNVMLTVLCNNVKGRWHRLLLLLVLTQHQMHACSLSLCWSSKLRKTPCFHYPHLFSTQATKHKKRGKKTNLDKFIGWLNNKSWCSYNACTWEGCNYL